MPNVFDTIIKTMTDAWHKTKNEATRLWDEYGCFNIGINGNLSLNQLKSVSLESGSFVTWRPNWGNYVWLTIAGGLGVSRSDLEISPYLPKDINTYGGSQLGMQMKIEYVEQSSVMSQEDKAPSEFERYYPPFNVQSTRCAVAFGGGGVQKINLSSVYIWDFDLSEQIFINRIELNFGADQNFKFPLLPMGINLSTKVAPGLMQVEMIEGIKKPTTELVPEPVF